MRREVRSTFVFGLLLLAVNIAAAAQTPDRGTIDEDIEKGDYNAALNRLRDGTTPEDLYRRGRAYEGLGKTGNAKKEYERAFLTSYANFRVAARDFFKAGGIDFRRFLIEHRKNNQVGVNASRRLIALGSDFFDVNDLRIGANALHAALKYSDSQDEIVGWKSGG